MPKIREKSLVINSEGFLAFQGENAGKGGVKWYKERGKWIIESRIEFPNPIFMTLDTPHGPNAKFLKNYDLKMREKLFSPREMHYKIQN